MTRWFDEHKRETFYRRAKREGYRARSAYKLLQIHERFHILKPGQTVLDLGCSPGGWTQVAVGLVGASGHVIGIDLEPTAKIEGAQLLRGDITKPETLSAVRDRLAAAGTGGVDAVVSDMSPDISGAYDRDQAQSVWLAGHALDVAQRLLKPGGSFVVKVFEGQDFQEYKARVRAAFKRLDVYRPPASRKASSEVYLVGRGHHAASADGGATAEA